MTLDEVYARWTAQKAGAILRPYRGYRVLTPANDNLRSVPCADRAGEVRTSSLPTSSAHPSPSPAVAGAFGGIDPSPSVALDPATFVAPFHTPEVN